MPTYISTLPLLALLSAAHSHMIMNTPTPFNHHGTARLLQVDPLGDALPFPCQGVSDVVSTTPLTAGGTQLVKFTGGAQHGGGSCQFAVTYDWPPPADKTHWKTIYTIIGGCPVSAAGNLPVTGADADGRADAAQCGDDAGTECIRQFAVPIPRGLPAGNATFAWTWFNKIGNREVYMNCAPVTVVGGAEAGDTGFLESLPPLFLANVPGECTTGQGVLNIPNSGRFGRVLEAPAPGSEGSCAKADGVPVFEGDDGANTTVPSSTQPSNPVQTASSATRLSSGFVTQTSTVTSTAATTTASDPTPGSGTSASSTASASATAGVGSNPVQCAPDGAIVCFGPSSFGLCAHGTAVPQPVAGGTTCAGGQILRRSARFAFGKP